MSKFFPANFQRFFASWIRILILHAVLDPGWVDHWYKPPSEVYTVHLNGFVLPHQGWHGCVSSSRPKSPPPTWGGGGKTGSLMWPVITVGQEMHHRRYVWISWQMHFSYALCLFPPSFSPTMPSLFLRLSLSLSPSVSSLIYVLPYRLSISAVFLNPRLSVFLPPLLYPISCRVSLSRPSLTLSLSCLSSVAHRDRSLSCLPATLTLLLVFNPSPILRSLFLSKMEVCANCQKTSSFLRSLRLFENEDFNARAKWI